MDKIEFLWSGFEPLGRILVVGTLGYLSIIFILRLSGNRSLASMNAFDFIITVTLGSAFGRVLTAKGVALSEAVVAFLLLVVLQYLVSLLESQSKAFKQIITSQPKLLYYHGGFISKNLRKERIDENELLGSARKKGFSSLEEIEAIILETDGSFSVIGKSKPGMNSTYEKLIQDEKSI